MSRLAGLKVLVAGGGAIGSITAWTLCAEGAEVVLADPADLGDNASGVAAGMLAPAFEAVLDPASGTHFELLAAARDAWPGFLARLGESDAVIDRSGALWVGDDASVAGMLARLRSLGAAAERIDTAQAGRLSPGLAAPAGAVFTSEDWRLEPRAMLAALRRGLLARGGQVRRAVVRAVGDGGAILSDGERIAADAVVLATGLAPAGLAESPPELAVLAPIKGQIARFAGAGAIVGPYGAGVGVYVTPFAGGAVAGATMEAGVADRGVDPQAISRLQALAAGLFPGLAQAKAAGAAGVRAATPDGLPMVGPASRPGVILALGARRNGWLLAPLIAGLVANGLAEGRWDPAFDPGRFGA